MNSEITVFIPVRNGAEFIGKTIESVLMQSFSNWQLIIKDNCSSDKTKDIVAKFIGDPRILWMERDQNIGAEGNFNSCLTDIPTKYYMILSHDDYLFSTQALEKAYNILETHPDIPKVHCDMMFVDEYSQSIAPRRFRRSGRVSSDNIAKKSILSVRNMYGIPLLIRANAVNEHRYQFYYASDIDFSVGIGKGMDIYHIPEILIALRIHKNNNTQRKYDSIAPELRLIAEKNRIHLTKWDHVVMVFNDYLQRIQKKIFFLYLAHFRK
ncbi:MAG: glycosyltransferase [Desulfobacterales bacterium]|nr:glycosyltransferase [Desulfobacterales bacterium]